MGPQYYYSLSHILLRFSRTSSSKSKWRKTKGETYFAWDIRELPFYTKPPPTIIVDRNEKLATLTFVIPIMIGNKNYISFLIFYIKIPSIWMFEISFKIIYLIGIFILWTSFYQFIRFFILWYSYIRLYSMILFDSYIFSIDLYKSHPFLVASLVFQGWWPSVNHKLCPPTNCTKAKCATLSEILWPLTQNPKP